MLGIACFIGAIIIFLSGDMLFILGVLAANYFINRGQKLGHGYNGEQKVLQEFEKLPDEYHLFANVRVHDRMESDLVVVGPSGVFLIEIKNYVGAIEGGTSDRQWTLHKVGRKDTRYEKELPNPIRQQKRNTFIVAQYLRQEGCPVWVMGCTLFPNIETSWKGRIPNECYTLIETLINNISNQERELSGGTIEKVVEALDKCVYGKPPMTAEEFEAKVQEQKTRKMQTND